MHHPPTAWRSAPPHRSRISGRSPVPSATGAQRPSGRNPDEIYIRHPARLHSPPSAAHRQWIGGISAIVRQCVGSGVAAVCAILAGDPVQAAQRPQGLALTAHRKRPAAPP